MIVINTTGHSQRRYLHAERVADKLTSDTANSSIFSVAVKLRGVAKGAVYQEILTTKATNVCHDNGSCPLAKCSQTQWNSS